MSGYSFARNPDARPDTAGCLDTTPRIAEGTSIDPGQSAVWVNAVGLVADQDAVEVIAGLRENAPGFGAELNRESDAAKPPANQGPRDPKRDNCRLRLR